MIENVQELEALIKEESIKRGLHYSALPKEDMNAPAFKSLLDYLNNLQLLEIISLIGLSLGILMMGYILYQFFFKDKMELPVPLIPTFVFMALIGSFLGGFANNDYKAYLNSALIENEMFYEITNNSSRRTPDEWATYKKNIRETFNEKELNLSPLGTLIEGSSNRTVSHYLFRYILFNLDETNSFLGDKDYYEQQKAEFSAKVLPKAKVAVCILGAAMVTSLAYLSYLLVNQKKLMEDEFVKKHFIWGTVAGLVVLAVVAVTTASYNAAVKDYYDVAGRNLLETIQSLKH